MLETRDELLLRRSHPYVRDETQYNWLQYKTIIHASHTLRPRFNGRHFPDDILKWNFLNKKNHEYNFIEVFS